MRGRRLYVGDNELRREAVSGAAEQGSDRRDRTRRTTVSAVDVSARRLHTDVRLLDVSAF